MRLLPTSILDITIFSLAVAGLAAGIYADFFRVLAGFFFVSLVVHLFAFATLGNIPFRETEAVLLAKGRNILFLMWRFQTALIPPLGILITNLINN